MLEPHHLPIESLRDASPLIKSFTEDDEENRNPIFMFSSFGYQTDDYLVFFGLSELRRKLLTKIIIKEGLKLVSDDDVYPKVPANITVASTSADKSQLYIKRPRPSPSFLNTSVTKTRFTGSPVTGAAPAQPACSHRPLSREHHIINRNRIVGLVLDRHPMTPWGH
jgi:hypothetical protein